MKGHLATLLAIASLALGGCVANADDPANDEPIDQSQSPLTNRALEARELAPFDAISDNDKIKNPVDRPVSLVTHSGRPPHTPQTVDGLRNP